MLTEPLPLKVYRYSFTTDSLFLPSLNTYPKATGFPNVPEATPHGGLCNLSVKNTGCLILESNCGINVVFGGKASICVRGMGVVKYCNWGCDCDCDCCLAGDCVCTFAMRARTGCWFIGACITCCERCKWWWGCGCGCGCGCRGGPYYVRTLETLHRSENRVRFIDGHYHGVSHAPLALRAEERRSLFLVTRSWEIKVDSLSTVALSILWGSSTEALSLDVIWQNTLQVWHVWDSPMSWCFAAGLKGEVGN